MKKENISLTLLVSFLFLPILSSTIGVPQLSVGVLYIGLVYLSIFVISPVLINNFSLLLAGMTVFFTLIVFGFNGSFSVLASGGVIFLVSYVFQLILRYTQGVTIPDLIRFISYGYRIILFFLVVEFLFCISGLQGFLDVVLPGYKVYNFNILPYLFKADFPFGGLNSIFLGSQIASVVCASCFLFHYIVYKKELLTVSLILKRIILLLSALLFVLSFTLTGFILFALFFWIYLMKSNRNLALLTLATIFLILWFDLNYGYVFGRVFSDRQVNLTPRDFEIFESFGMAQTIQEMSVFDYYLFHLFSPFFVFLKLPIDVALFGFGNDVFKTGTFFISGENAFGVSLLSSGSLWFGFFWISIFIIHFPAIVIYFRHSSINSPIASFHLANSLCSLMFLASAFHYGHSLFNIGVLGLVSFHIAVSCFIWGKYK